MGQIRAYYHFNLRTPKAHKASTINFVAYINGTQFVVSTKVKVNPLQWDKKKEVCKISPLYNDIDNYNNTVANEVIKGFQDKFYSFTLELIKGSTTTFKQYFTAMNNKTDGIELMQEVINKQENVKANKLYSNKLDILKMFVGKKKLSLEDIATTTFIKKFSEWLHTKYVGKTGNKISTSYYNDIIGKLRTILKWCVVDDKLNNNTYNNIVFPIDRRNKVKLGSNQVFLTNEEVMAIYNYKAENKRMDISKDIFLLACTTGMRVSDIKQFSPKTIYKFNNSRYGINLTTIKTGTNINTLLVFDIAKKILVDKYHCILPKFVEGTTNKDIKAIAKECGLDRMVKQKKQDVGKQVEEYEVPLYKAIHLHTGRHTFDVLCIINLGWPLDRISKAVGHSDDMVKYYTQSQTDIERDKALATKTNNPDKYVWSIDELEQYNKLNKENKKKALNELFAYDSLIELSKLVDIDFYHLPITKQAISTIKDISKLSSYNTVDIDKVLSLDRIVFNLSCYFHDVQLYQMYQYKEKYYDIISKVDNNEDIELMFHNEDIEVQRAKILDEYKKQGIELTDEEVNKLLHV